VWNCSYEAAQWHSRRFAQDDRYHSALPEKERTVAVIWIASMIVIGDGMLFLLLFLLRDVVKG
jgi:hypothetical protein